MKLCVNVICYSKTINLFLYGQISLEKKGLQIIKEKMKYFEVPEVILFERRVLIGLALLVELLTFAALFTVLCKDCFVGIESASA